MGGGCSKINNVARPNPKDPAINTCTEMAIGTNNINNPPATALVGAKYYCNQEGANPKLVAGFSAFAGLAQEDPAAYGTLLYKEILTSLDRNINPLDAARGFIGTYPLDKALSEIAGGVFGLVKYQTLRKLASTLNLAAKTLGRKFFEGLAKLAESDSALLRALGFVGKIVGYAGSIAINAIRLAAEFAKNPIRFVARLAVGIVKGIYKGVVAGVKYAAGKFKPTTKATEEQEIEMQKLDKNGVATGTEGEDTDAVEAGADEAGGTVSDFLANLLPDLGFLQALPGIDVLADIGSIIYGVYSVVLDYLGEENIKYEISYCNNIGDRFEGDENTDTEWTVYDNDFEKNCHYDDTTRGYKVNSSCACCYGACAIIGTGLRCIRQNFRADPFVCCMNDYACNKADNPDTCFQTPARQRTCHPLFRDLSSNFCRDIIYDYCSGDELLPTQNDWLEMWLEDSFVEINSKMIVSNLQTKSDRYNGSEDINLRGIRYPLKQKQPCLRAIARAVSISKGVCTFEDLQKIDLVEGMINSEGFVWSKNLLEKVFKRYTDEGGSFLGGINTDGINRDSSFYNTMWKICNQIPGLCTNILNDMCANYTSEDLLDNPFLLPWCSCYLPNEQYQKYEVFGINRECTPLCNRNGVIPTVSATGQRNLCQQTVCMIDNTTIDLINTEFDGGSININQICASCGRSNVNASYKYGNITDDITVDTSYFIPPPTTTNEGYYKEVYGSGFDLTKNNQQKSLVIPIDDYRNGSYTNKDYYSCILGYAKSTEKGDVGVVSIIIFDDKDNNPPKLIPNNEYVFGIDADTGKKLFTGTGGAPAKVKIIKSSIKGSNTVSHNSTTYGQEGYNASINTCSCITSGFSLKVADSKISGSINFVQECGDSQCFDDQNRPVPCTSTGENPDPIKTIEEIEEEIVEDLTRDRFQLMFFSALGLFVIIVIFFMFRFFYKSCYRIIYTLLDKYVILDAPN